MACMDKEEEADTAWGGIGISSGIEVAQIEDRRYAAGIT